MGWVNALLPEDKPRHLLGIGEPVDLFGAVENGADLFDCVAPTRIARNGGLYTKMGRINILNSEFIAEHGKPDVVITDPPRAGMHQDVVTRLLEMEAEKIVYVSCNAATQARDIALLKEKYEVTRIRPVDMFPHTQHVENVVLLQLNLNAPSESKI